MGAALGAGQAFSARLAARASLLAVPVIWVIVAAFLLEPNSQEFVLWLFTKASLRTHSCLKQLLRQPSSQACFVCHASGSTAQSYSAG